LCFLFFLDVSETQPRHESCQRRVRQSRSKSAPWGQAFRRDFVRCAVLLHRGNLRREWTTLAKFRPAVDDAQVGRLHTFRVAIDQCNAALTQQFLYFARLHVVMVEEPYAPRVARGVEVEKPVLLILVPKKFKLLAAGIDTVRTAQITCQSFFRCPQFELNNARSR